MNSLSLTYINKSCDFPSPDTALLDPDGLLGFGDDLNTELVLSAYSRGIFPWYSDEQPILWWSPSKRAVLTPANICIKKSLKQSIRKRNYCITINTNFNEVIQNCAQISRKGQQDTWITDEMLSVYSELHLLEKAHSIEAWYENELIGGLYGIYSNGIFCGESMFSLKTDASKMCLVALCQNAESLGIALIDCQIINPHLKSLGATEITRDQFLKQFNSDSKELIQPKLSILEIKL